MNRKGQWFLISSLVLITMITMVVIGKTQIRIGPESGAWQKNAFENVKSQSFFAINSMIQENATSKNVEERSRDYLDFVQNFGDARGINLSAYFIIGIPAGDGINVSIINFGRIELRNVSVTLDGSTQTIHAISDKKSATLAFASLPDYFAANYSLKEINATGGIDTGNLSFAAAKNVFSIIKVRVESKDGSQIWQTVERR